MKPPDPSPSSSFAALFLQVRQRFCMPQKQAEYAILPREITAHPEKGPIYTEWGKANTEAIYLLTVSPLGRINLNLKFCVDCLVKFQTHNISFCIGLLLLIHRVVFFFFWFCLFFNVLHQNATDLRSAPRQIMGCHQIVIIL